MSINAVEAFWIFTNLATLFVTFAAFLDALADRRTYLKLTDVGERSARAIAARGNVRREVMRLIVQILLLAVIVPGLFVDRPVEMSAPVLALITVPVMLLAASLMDALDRRELARLTLADVISERERVDAYVENRLRALGVADTKAEGRMNDMDDRMDAAEHVTSDEMTRTDEHQEVQDDRIDAVEQA